jgi:hypothetical protein
VGHRYVNFTLPEDVDVRARRSGHDVVQLLTAAAPCPSAVARSSLFGRALRGAFAVEERQRGLGHARVGEGFVVREVG